MTKQEAIEVVDELVTEIRGLRVEAEQATARLLARLCEIEAEHLETIKLAGCASFAQWLNSEVKIHPARYENFKAGVVALGGNIDEAIAIGAEATIVLAKSHTPERVPAFVEAIKAEIELTSCSPSPKAASDILRKVDPREEVPRGMRVKTRIQQLEEENARLRVENRKLKALVSKLERDLEKSKKAA